MGALCPPGSRLPRRHRTTSPSRRVRDSRRRVTAPTRPPSPVQHPAGTDFERERRSDEARPRETSRLHDVGFGLPPRPRRTLLPAHNGADRGSPSRRATLPPPGSSSSTWTRAPGCAPTGDGLPCYANASWPARASRCAPPRRPPVVSTAAPHELLGGPNSDMSAYKKVAFVAAWIRTFLRRQGSGAGGGRERGEVDRAGVRRPACPAPVPPPQLHGRRGVNLMRTPRCSGSPATKQGVIPSTTGDMGASASSTLSTGPEPPSRLAQAQQRPRRFSAQATSELAAAPGVAKPTSCCRLGHGHQGHPKQPSVHPAPVITTTGRSRPTPQTGQHRSTGATRRSGQEECPPAVDDLAKLPGPVNPRVLPTTDE